MRRTILSAAVAMIAFGACGAAAAADLPSYIRVPDPQLRVWIADALDRSSTLRRLVDRVGELDGIVYVVRPGAGNRVGATLLGGLSHNVVSSGSVRLLQMVIVSGLQAVALPTVGHELRHAVEVLEDPGARSEETVDALFARIGWRTSSRTVETQAALDAGHAVARELKTEGR